ncbi:MAG: LPS assembly protein LptD [Deltaproteobacteria bacterium]|nr:LPS assembly protein LptD [Deltaproteobacteria bacterium]
MTRRLHLFPLATAMLAAFFLFALVPGQTFAAEISYEAEGPVTMEADTLTYNQQGDSISLEGAVRILYRDMTVQADKVIFYDKTKDVVAEGGVVLTEGEDILRCDRLELNIETKKGTIYRGKIFLKKKNFHVTGGKMEKLGESEYRVHDARLTTCDAKLPYWMFTVKRLDVDVEGFGQGWWAGFRVLDIPVLYFPWAIFPVKRDRQSGFLFPDFGSSSKWGPEFRLPFYWNIAPNQDATFYVERIGDTRGRGWKEGAEYRYAWSTQAQGKISGNYIWDERGDQSPWWKERQDKSRWSIFAEHDQRFPHGYYLKTNINWVSDKNYTVDFPSDIPKETRIDATSLSQLESTITVGKNWEWGAMEADAYYFRRLYFPDEFPDPDPMQADDNGITMQMLPQVNLSLYQNRLLETPIFYEMEAQGTNYWRRELPTFLPPSLVAREVLRGGRIDLYPRVSIPLKPLDIVRFEPWIGYRETIYFDPTGKLDDLTSREIYDAGASLATTVSRVFPLEWGKVKGLKHIIEPKVIYTYIPGVNQSDNPDFTHGINTNWMQTDNPYFNHGIDTITRQNTITWMLTNYLIGKEVGKDGEVSYPEYLYLKIYQGYNFSPDLTLEGGHRRHLSNLAAEARIAPFTWLSGTMNLQYNPYLNVLDTFNAGVQFADTRGDKLGVQYRFTRPFADSLGALAGVEEINAELGIRIIKPLDLYFDYRYNLRDNVRIETVYGLDYRHQCWEVSLRVHDINRQPDPTEPGGYNSELKVMVWLTLTGLGKYRVQ